MRISFQILSHKHGRVVALVNSNCDKGITRYVFCIELSLVEDAKTENEESPKLVYMLQHYA